MKFLYSVEDPSCLIPAPLPDCLYHVSFRRYSPLSVEVVVKLNKCKSFFAPNFFLGGDHNFQQQIVSAIYHPPFGKVWLSSVCWSPSAKPGNKAECRIYGGWVKMAVEFEAVCGPKFVTFWDDVGDPLLLSKHLTDCLCRVSFRRYRPLKLPLSREVGPKRWFLGPRFVGGGDIPDFRYAFSNYSYFRACSRFWLSSVQWVRRFYG